ncbi:Putative F-box/LRR-repeat protein At5g02930 [Linum grandiflorum]
MKTEFVEPARRSPDDNSNLTRGPGSYSAGTYDQTTANEVMDKKAATARRAFNSAKRYRQTNLNQHSSLGFEVCASMVRRRKTIRNRSSIDRLSDLPDCMLHHILSFLDTQSSVQTSVLSKRWTSLWKYVHVLTFSTPLFRTNSAGLESFVENVLSHRSDCSRVTRVTWKLGGRGIKDLVDKVIRYAASHGVQELYLLTNNGSPDAFESICASYQSLKVLEIEGIDIEKTHVGLWSRFQLLETLTLTYCNLVFADAATDAFANFPRLETLKLLYCNKLRDCDDDTSETSVLKVTAPKLLHLEMVSTFFNSLEIVAPKLQSFTLLIDEYSSPTEKLILDVSKSNLPSLNSANINLQGYLFCVNLFKVLHNVQALTLEVDKFELLIETCNLVKPQSSPFTRLKSVHVTYRTRRSIEVGHQRNPRMAGRVERSKGTDTLRLRASRESISASSFESGVQVIHS